MKFLSVYCSPEYVLKPGAYRTVETAVGAVAQAVRGTRVKFTPLENPVPVTILPAKQGERVARGILDSKSAAAKAGIDEDVLIAFLREHERYGLDFVGVDSDGQITAEEEVDPIENLGPDEGYFCKLCEQHLSTPQAVGGHTRSNVHKDAVARARDRAAEKLREITSDVPEESDEARAVAAAQAAKKFETGEDPAQQHASG